jgi:hypothetical protein
VEGVLEPLGNAAARTWPSAIKSMPAENTGPAPATMIALTWGCWSAARTVSASSSTISGVRALRFSGRLSVT